MYCAMCINEKKSKKDALCFNINADNKCQIKKKKKRTQDWCFFYGCYHPAECFFF